MQQTNRHAGTKSFLRGLARALDLRGSIVPTYAPRRRARRSDQAAIEADWSAVWNDLGIAFTRVKQRDAARSHG
ncbi:MAG TPA: hypothetical protein VF771_21050 [Longimicrobiaceae bacterium]